MSKKKKKGNENSIARNPKASHEYILSERTEAGLSLDGWEVKSLRSGQASMKGAYCIVQNNDVLLMGCHITPLNTSTSHIHCEPERPRKLLLNKREMQKFKDLVERNGFAIVAIDLYWKGPWAKVEIALGKGKNNQDKREADKSKDWDIEKARTMKNALK